MGQQRRRLKPAAGIRVAKQPKSGRRPNKQSGAIGVANYRRHVNKKVVNCFLAKKASLTGIQYGPSY